ncbi:hypothetical protein [Streptomyces gardneri]|uniref:hypothetical protein n=1 Tax=Streptomyces gardneri TaxID=66892 RepID=UPI0035DEBC6C
MYSITPYESVPIPARLAAVQAGDLPLVSDREGLAALFGDTPTDDTDEDPFPGAELGLPGITESVEGEM